MLKLMPMGNKATNMEPLPSATQMVRYERWNLALIYANSLVFAGLFGAENIAAYLVKAVFNGSGIIMVAGLLSLVAGNLWAFFGYSKAIYQWGTYWSIKLLFYLQCGLMLAFLAMLLSKHI